MKKYYILQFTRVSVVGKTYTDSVSETIGGEAIEFKDVSECERWMNKNREILFIDAKYTPKLIYRVA
jgi:hypothetical protein